MKNLFEIYKGSRDQVKRSVDARLGEGWDINSISLSGDSIVNMLAIYYSRKYDEGTLKKDMIVQDWSDLNLELQVKNEELMHEIRTLKQKQEEACIKLEAAGYLLAKEKDKSEKLIEQAVVLESNYERVVNDKLKMKKEADVKGEELKHQMAILVREGIALEKNYNILESELIRIKREKGE